MFDPLIQEYHGISPDAMHKSDMNPAHIKVNLYFVSRLWELFCLLTLIALRFVVLGALWPSLVKLFSLSLVLVGL